MRRPIRRTGNISRGGILETIGSELAYTEFTTNVTVSATTEGAAQDVVSAGAVWYDPFPIVVEFYCPDIEAVSASSSGLFLLLQDGATVLGRLCYNAVGLNTQSDWPIHVRRRIVPTAGSHTYKVTSYRVTANWTVYGQGGGSGTSLPGFIRVSRADG